MNCYSVQDSEITFLDANECYISLFYWGHVSLSMHSLSLADWGTDCSLGAAANNKNPQSRPDATKPLGRALPVSVIHLLLQFGFTPLSVDALHPTPSCLEFSHCSAHLGGGVHLTGACSTQIFHLLFLKQSWITCHWDYFYAVQH